MKSKGRYKKKTPNLRVPASKERSKYIYFQNKTKKLEAINSPHLFLFAYLTH